ncbi:hypothetical protein ACN38_g9675 [Penicillium nordicum]|uniref:Uncharacterized protein n=1 Tax=Penicillium nordicum TaxID=229535 RepID=A0A0M9WCC5_9EURO|nr:hypothetical protein ACN38_g9675 [Penicillium nordicum]
MSQLAADVGFERNEQDQRRAHHHVKAHKSPRSILLRSCVWRGNSKQLLEVLRALGAFTGGRDGNIFLPLGVLAIIGDFRSERRSIDSCPSKLSS